ncbi:ribosome biogenesis factor YjgA [Methylomonas montana]|uniref:ribosome biogenesis factor YjgA n=1 Tax=Methylomonas montana TaxID=3058963 RepID=UPI0026599D83|nr:ribosome biogenesis factor YjgA [Methylomonas montana]WKJ90328.1 ribosome biogenesis factor YjgA [Methylomonas montana]
MKEEDYQDEYEEEDYYDETEGEEGETEGEEVEYYAIRPNKTRIKKEIAAIFAIAEEICSLSPAHIAEFELPENIEQALRDAGKMGQNSARKRLLKYITAQLRKLDTEAIQEKLARMKNRSAHAVREHHQAERWRDLLLADSGNAQLTQLIEEYPAADSQHVRQLQRNAQKEAKEAKPPKSARLLYKYLKELIADAAGLPQIEEDERNDEGADD